MGSVGRAMPDELAAPDKSVMPDGHPQPDKAAATETFRVAVKVVIRDRSIVLATVIVDTALLAGICYVLLLFHHVTENSVEKLAPIDRYAFIGIQIVGAIGLVGIFMAHLVGDLREAFMRAWSR
jgi:hypothetical protein